MGTARVLTGRYANILERATLVSSGAADGDYPLSRLVDLQPDKDARAAAAGADDSITADVNLTTNPAFAFSGGSPTGWTVLGTVVETTTAGEVRSGSAVKITGNSSGVQQDLTVRSGDYAKIDVWARISAAAAGANVIIQNRHTENYLTPAGGWSATPQPCKTTTSTSYVNLAQEFRLESYHDCGDKNEVTLRIQLTASGDAAQFAFFDDALFYMGFNFMAVIGHNLDPFIDPQLRASTDNFAADDDLIATAYGSFQPYSFAYGVATMQFYRYVRLKMVGTNVTGPWSIGEWIAGQAAQPLQQYESFDWTPLRQWNRQQSRNPVGKRFGHRRTKYPTRGVALSYWFAGSDAQTNLDDLVDTFDRAQGGTWPVVIMPDIDLLTDVIHGFLPDALSLSRHLPDHFDGLELSVDPSPFPSAT